LSDKSVIVGITGASGGPYALRLIDCLDASGVKIDLAVSPMGRKLLTDECGIKDIEVCSLIGRRSENITIHDYNDLTVPPASGSYLTRGMIICPCSSNTLGATAAGLGDNLITRAAHVTLKEGRPLIVVFREMPVSGITLENMLRLQRGGAIICPASPGFYNRPKGIEDLIDFVVGRVLDLIGVEHSLPVRWNQ